LPNPPTRYAISIKPSQLALGTARLGAFWQGKSLSEAMRTVHAALDVGINVIDTADVYALGLSERILGLVLQSRRERALVCTKVGQLKTPVATLVAHCAESRVSWRSLAAAIPRPTPADVSRVPRCYASRYIEHCVRGSLKKLRTQHLDVLFLHSPSLEDLAERTFELAAQALLKAGDIGHFGVSCDSAQIARCAAEIPYVSFVEVPMHGKSADNQRLAAHLAGKGVGVLARSPFGGGGELAAVGRDVENVGTEVAACCLQEVTSIPGVLSTVVGMSSPRRVRENVALAVRSVAPDTRERVRRALDRHRSPEILA
jgi:aryl-alcohol dehydrogenase-like predicted oxidoreductase